MINRLLQIIWIALLTGAVITFAVPEDKQSWTLHCVEWQQAHSTIEQPVCVRYQ